MNDKIVLHTPSNSFSRGLPIGNGRIAAMLLGQPTGLRLALTHEWLWDTLKKDNKPRRSAEHLGEVREAFISGDYARGTELHNKYFTGPEGMPWGPSCFQPACALNIKLPDGEVTDYLRSLDLKTGVADICFVGDRCGRVTQQCFISSADDVGVIKLCTPNQPRIELFYSRPDDPSAQLERRTTDCGLILEGHLPYTMHFAVETRIQTDGRLTFDGDLAVIEGASETVIFYQLGTNAKGGSPFDEMHFTDRTYDRLLERHKDRFGKLLGNAWLQIDAPDGEGDVAARIEQLRSGGDVTLPVLFFNFGKYLLAASSSTELPMNLQGKWCEEINPPWQSDYHLDINLQMCYWFANTLGMDELALPLFELLDRCVESGRQTARDTYGLGGICFPLTTDCWANVAQNNFRFDGWVGGAPWCAQHYWRHWQYTQDIDFLRERAYPFIKEAATFCEEYLFEQDGELVIAPSVSPENTFIGCEAYPIAACKNSTMDLQLFTECLQSAADAADILGVDAERATKWRNLASRIPQAKIGSDGQLLEWDAEYAEKEPGHRHMSHLYGLYPAQLYRYDDPHGIACGKSLDARLAAGSGQSGWSRSWAACLMAQLHRPEQAWQNLKNLICDHVSPTLLDLHPPGINGTVDDIFQIDGNMGGTAAICEMLLQSREGEIDLLPACPVEWPSGAFGGFKAKGNVTVDLEWQGGRATKAVLRSPIAQTIKLLVGNCEMNIDLLSDKKITVRLVDGEYEIA